MLGFILQPNLQIQGFSNLDKVLLSKQYFIQATSPFSVAWVQRQHDPTPMLGFILQPNLQIQGFSNLDKVLLSKQYFI
jgi:hypothetical protein